MSYENDAEELESQKAPAPAKPAGAWKADSTSGENKCTLTNIDKDKFGQASSYDLIIISWPNNPLCLLCNIGIAMKYASSMLPHATLQQNKTIALQICQILSRP